MAPLLEVKDLRTYFHTREGVVRAVDDVSFIMEHGETLGLVGESGSGKSVTALSIMRLIASPPGRIETGQVLLNGVDLLQLSDEDMRRVRGKEIAMIFQEPMTSLNPVLTIGRQIGEALELHMKMSPKQARNRTIELLERVRIPEAAKRVDAYPHQFSGGMRQRVMIAMGLSCNPKILLADEPTTALDVTIQAQVLEVMKDLTTEFGTSVILITHNLGIVARYANNVNVMYAGRIVEHAAAAELYKQPSHPYTLGLLHSIPRLDEEIRSKLDPIQGLPPDMAHPPEGCRFEPRCPFAQDQCRTEYPPLETRAPGHLAACWVDVKTGKIKERV
jgi:oligopeptide transport system ATP-binding protein